MSDIIKEFNMTDLLGMLVPGSAVAFLLDKEYKILSNLSRLTKATFSPSIKITLVIVVGYFIGMLLHEIGDCIEKALWCFPFFNPRIYAACSTGVDQYYEGAPNRKKRAILIIKCIIGLVSFAILCCLFLRIAVERPCPFLCHLTIGIVVAMVLGSVSYTICAWKHYKKTERWPGLCAFCKSLCPSLLSSLQEVEIICTDNQPLSYNVWKVNDDNDEYVRMVLRKRDLFDGFRTAARNLLVTFILVGLHAQTPSGLTHDLREMVLQKPEFIWIIGAAVLILLLRYYHFTYLRYKYCYEDYKFQRERQKAPRESSNGCCNQVFIGIRRKDS